MGEYAWIVGVLTLMVVVSGCTLWLGRGTEAPFPEVLWDLPNQARTYTTVVASLAGFAATSVVFAARLGVDRPGPEFETVMALLVFGFFILLASAMQLANTPSAVGREDAPFIEVQRLAHLLANVTFSQGLSTSWLALGPLTHLVGATELEALLRWFLPMAVVMSGLWIGQYLDDMTPLRGRAARSLAPLAFASAALYVLVLGRTFPALLPTALPLLRLAALGAVVTVVGYALQMVMFGLFVRGRLRDGTLHTVKMWAVAHASYATVVNGLLAFTVIAT